MKRRKETALTYWEIQIEYFTIFVFYIYQACCDKYIEVPKLVGLDLTISSVLNKFVIFITHVQGVLEN